MNSIEYNTLATASIRINMISIPAFIFDANNNVDNAIKAKIRNAMYAFCAVNMVWRILSFENQIFMEMHFGLTSRMLIVFVIPHVFDECGIVEVLYVAFVHPFWMEQLGLNQQLLCKCWICDGM